ncbi:hypothetical protein JYB64_11415 [Algoriphagus aestuarii]|nr:hypothetical protein [Algoriphagus aestuarii]
MTGIENIDFGKLKPYDGKVTKCFEQLCYQIAIKEYGHLGKFTPIDGSGGDGGVEFYLEHNNGETWGWQCKFFGDTGRLNVGQRKNQIASSLETACRNHPNLTKWTLCLKTDLTANSLTKTGKQQKGEQDWFDNELPKKIPSGRTISLEHWGESKFLTFLNSPKHIGIRSFFFGGLEFNQEWFKRRFDENFEKVKDKYDPDLHSIDQYTQSKIDFSLFSLDYLKHIERLKKELLDKSNQITSAIVDFRDEKMISAKEESLRNSYVFVCQDFQKHISIVFEKIDFIEKCFHDFNETDLSSFQISDLRKSFFEYFEKIDYSVFEEKSRALRDASSISYLISEFGEIYERFFRNYFHGFQNVIHFISDAGKGKTHLSCDIAFKRIQKNEPAIFLTGDKFSGESSISEGILKTLDVSSQFSIDEFFESLNVYGSIVKKKVPIIIDGLNETVDNRYFSLIWKNHLSSFVTKAVTFKNLAFISTCRNSYTQRIWADSNDNFHYLYGFDDFETIREAVSKYFTKYNLKADLFFAPLEKFREPIFLKIFCEIKNPDWRNGKTVQVNIEEESTYEVFKEYLDQVNKRLNNDSHLLKNNEPFIFNSLSLLSEFLWHNDLREIPIDEFYKLIDGDKEYEKDNSKAELLINEGLVMTRDVREDFEFVSITYDMLAGYLIGIRLIESNVNLKYFISSEFIDKIIQEDGQHPLYEDVLNALCVLMPQLKYVSMHELLEADWKLQLTKKPFFEKLPNIIKKQFQRRISFSNHCFSQSITALFSLPARYVKDPDKELVRILFNRSSKNQKPLLDLCFKTIADSQHPLNANFISDVLASMEMNSRDLSWTEYIRKRAYDLEEFIDEFDRQCQLRNEESENLVRKQWLLAKFVMWFLTSTNRNLRDKATKALYYYGIKFPASFSKLVFESLKINDPYVWERSLAALYGVTMACHNSLDSAKFREELLVEIGRSLHRLIFMTEAPFSTTHILARDYARRTIEICLIHHSNLLTSSEIEEIRPPYSYGGIRDLGELDHEEIEFSYSGPIQMDFSNYTIGRIVKDGGSYANPPEKVKVRKQILWRIHDLGWNEELFQEAETSLGNDNYYSGRTERAKVERYGKKYSWIAFFENAGLRDDLGLLDKEWDRFRLSDADIDPSFPQKPPNELFVTHDLLGDRNSPLKEWYEEGGMPHIEDYLTQTALKGQDGEWICLDGFIIQEDVPAERERFTFIRSFLVEEKDYSKVMDLLNKQNLGGRWLPEKQENYYTYAGELYIFDDATYDNYTELEFVVGKRKEKVKPGEPGYYPSIFLDRVKEGIQINKEFPEEIEIEVSEMEKFEVLMPVMEYNWESHHSSVNKAGHVTVVAKELANQLELVNQPQTFDLLNQDGSTASINIHFHKEYNNNHSLVYLRKDLLDKYLKDKKMKFVWAIWGERQLTFKTNERRTEFFTANPFKDHQVFQKVIEYEK